MTPDTIVIQLIAATKRNDLIWNICHATIIGKLVMCIMAVPTQAMMMPKIPVTSAASDRRK
jgi:hypothetical protein